MADVPTNPSPVDRGMLLVEVGVEELPVSFLHSALNALPGLFESALRRVQLAHGEISAVGTPRRLAVLVKELSTRQPDRDEEVTGPPAKVGFDDRGAPTAAAVGFARKHGVGPEGVFEVTTPKGSYAAVRVQESGKDAETLLTELVPQVLSNVPFPKVMRWGSVDQAFGRPVQWLVVLREDRRVHAEFAGVVSGRDSRGHRFLFPDSFSVEHASAYLEALRLRQVVVDVQSRTDLTRNGLIQAAQALGARLVEDPFLLRECASLVEMPAVVPGRFDQRFLALPDEVVISVMRDHQRYFALRNEAGDLLPSYLNVVNTAANVETIAAGNDRVLRARLEDASFFYQEDQKQKLRDRVSELDRVTFHRKLGSVGDKIRRLEKLAALMVDDPLEEGVKSAARLAKADLTTLMVGEFPELQGVMGSHYAASQGEPKEVAVAIEEHYLPKGADSRHDQGLPRGAIGSAVAAADRIDTLVGILGIGHEPSGSADPFALRRAALGLLRIAVFGVVEKEINLRQLIQAAYDLFPEGTLLERQQVLERAFTFVSGRLRHLLAGDATPDTVGACEGAWNGESVRDVYQRVRALSAFREKPEFERLILAYRRAHNIVKKAAEPAGAPAGRDKHPLDGVSASLLEAGAEQNLAERFQSVFVPLQQAREERDYNGFFDLVVSKLGPPIDEFFEQVFVMVDDTAIRENRLRLLSAIRDAVGSVARLEALQVDELS